MKQSDEKEKGKYEIEREKGKYTERIENIRTEIEKYRQCVCVREREKGNMKHTHKNSRSHEREMQEKSVCARQTSKESGFERDSREKSFRVNI